MRETLIENLRSLQEQHANLKSDHRRIADLILSKKSLISSQATRTTALMAEQLANEALSGAEPTPQVELLPTFNVAREQLTVQGLDSKLIEIANKISMVESDHHQAVLKLAQSDERLLVNELKIKETEYAGALARLLDLGQDMMIAGLHFSPEFTPRQIQDITLPNASTDTTIRNGDYTYHSPTHRLYDVVRAESAKLPESYKASLEQTGIKMKLRGY